MKPKEISKDIQELVQTASPPRAYSHRCMGNFFPGASQIIFKPESKARLNFFLDFLSFFCVKLIKIVFFFRISASKIDFSDNNRVKNS